MYKKWVFWIVLGLIVLLPFIQAATTATTLFVWNVPAGTRSYSVTYGAACSATEFFFNEIDANFDPDIDGNAAKVPPTANAISDTNYLFEDYNYVGITAPSTGPAYAYLSTTLVGDPTALEDVSTEFITGNYTNAATAGDVLYAQVGLIGLAEYGASKHVFKVDHNAQRVKQMKLNYSVVSFEKVIADPCITDTLGTEIVTRIFAWNWRTSAYDNIVTFNNMQTDPSSATFTPASFTFDSTTVTSVTDYIGPDTNVVIAISLGPVAVASGCIIIDEVDLNVTHYPDNNVYCQTSTRAPITITNTGQATLNIDGNFSTAFSGNDINLVLKVWQGTGSGCGTAGMGGWEKDCSVTNAQQDLGMTTCRNYNEYNSTTNGRLISSLVAGDTNQLCFSGDINGFVRKGVYAKTFQVGDHNS